MWFKKKKKLSVKQIADVLHCAGLNAFHDYGTMGKSNEEWDAFRFNLAIEIEKRILTYAKR